MANGPYAKADVAVGGGDGFELSVTAAGGEQKFALALDDIPALVQALAAVAWASAANNRPPSGTHLPTVHAFPVKSCNIGITYDAKQPVLAVELFGGVKFGLQFTAEAAQGIATEFAKLGAPGPLRS